MKKKKEIIAKKFAEEFQIPEDAVMDTFGIEFCGGNNVTVDGCNGIVEYEDTAIALNLGATVVRFRGADLEIIHFFERSVVIKGFIAVMEFSS